ncbi:MAG: hypothetical protein HWE27_11965 [Gammaproteobacteria bacterium]|nr:hypothetical protein [Gammaproteobacteria bacterium]
MMRHYFYALFLLYGLNLFATEQPYNKENRIEYINSVLLAINSAKLQDIFNVHSYINVVDRNNCSSSLSSLRTQCLIQYAIDNCKSLRQAEQRNYCELYSDIIVANKLSENVFIPRKERYRILKNSVGDRRQVILNKLEQKYSRLVTQFALTAQTSCEYDNNRCMAENLDSFCLQYTNQQSLSWQYCTSAIIWFLGTSR